MLPAISALIGAKTVEPRRSSRKDIKHETLVVVKVMYNTADITSLGGYKEMVCCNMNIILYIIYYTDYTHLL